MGVLVMLADGPEDESKETPTIVDAKGRVDPADMARWLLSQRHFLAFYDDPTELYYYSDGTYHRGGGPLAEAMLEARIEDKANIANVREALAHVRRMRAGPRSMVDDGTDWLCLRNGIVNVRTGEFSPHTPMRVFLTRLPVAYDPAATCPKVDRFFAEIVPPEDVPLLYEAIANCLLPGYPIQKAFMFVGNGNNGKSTYLGLVREFLGRENCSAIALQDLDRNRFASSELYGKLANICPDISSSELRRTSTFKGLTGGDLLTCEAKYQRPFVFSNRAKLLYSCNTVPLTEDESNAFYRRWVLVDFPNSFEGAAAKLNLLDELTAPAELSGLLNKVIPLCARLLEQGGFSGGGTTEATRLKYIRLSDPVYCWFEVACRVDSGGIGVHGEEIGPPTVRKADLYKAYVDYCKAEGIPAKSDKAFNRRLLELVPTISEVRVKEGGHFVRCWRGIELLDEGTIAQNKAQSNLFQF